MQLNYYVLGQRIQKIRKNKRISQAVLSTMIDKSAGYISYLECGTKVMSLETFVGIANALEATEMSNAEAQKIFANCTPYETYVLLDVLKTTKNALRSHHHLLKDEW